MEEDSLQQKKSVAVLDFVKTPYYKLEEAHTPYLNSVVKACLLSFFEKKPGLARSLELVSLISSNPEAAIGNLFEEVSNSLPTRKTTSQFQLNHSQSGNTANTFENVYKSLEAGLFKTTLIGGISFPSTKTNHRKKTGALLNKHEQRIKKSFGELKELDDDDFLEVLNHPLIQAEQNYSHEASLSREELDYFAFSSFQNYKLKKNKQAQKIAVVTKEPHFHLIKEDQILQAQTPAYKLRDATPLLKGNFSSLTGYNSSFTMNGMSFLLLAEKEKAKTLGYEPSCFIQDTSLLNEPIRNSLKAFLTRNKLSLKCIDFFEISECSAATPLKILKGFPEIKRERVNTLGGSLSYGYAEAASDLQSIFNLKTALELSNGTFGLAMIKNPYDNRLFAFLLKRTLK